MLVMMIMMTMMIIMFMIMMMAGLWLEAGGAKLPRDPLYIPLLPSSLPPSSLLSPSSSPLSPPSWIVEIIMFKFCWYSWHLRTFPNNWLLLTRTDLRIPPFLRQVIILFRNNYILILTFMIWKEEFFAARLKLLIWLNMSDLIERGIPSAAN